ncbi:MAG: hypothetical protein OHK0046_17250 [Anaerolineae bacterium]
MPTYQDWNDALIKYTLQGLSLGSHIFLSIDEEAIEIIALLFNEPRPPHGWVEEFKRIVRNRCIYNEEVNVPRFAQPLRDTRKYPRYVPFLATMVFAAYLMGEDEDKNINSNDYFTHLNSVLGLEGKRGRISGLTRGEDGKLWEDWANWLRTSGYLPTAYPGEGPEKYKKYPKSQTLLRKADKDKLWRHFTHANWRKDYDEIILMQRIRRDVQYLTTHLQEILDPKGDMWLRSYEAISRACYEVYEDWREAGETDSRTGQATVRLRTSLDARLYRTEDYFTGTVEYRLFPRQARQAASITVNVLYEGVSYPLSEDRPGWYMPLWSIDTGQLTNGFKLPLISSNSQLQHLYLPARDFWVLTLDPQIPESGVYASWDKGVEIGSPFILLAREALRADLVKLKNEGLLEWESVSSIFDGWNEYRGVTVQAEAQVWASITLENDELRLTLQPRTNFSLAFTGGLRAPRGSGWLVNHGPKVSLASFIPEAELAVYTEDDEVVFSDSIEAGKTIEIPWGMPGSYKVIVTQDGHSDERVVRILDWSEMDMRPLSMDEFPSEENFGIYGALIKD